MWSRRGGHTWVNWRQHECRLPVPSTSTTAPKPIRQPASESASSTLRQGAPRKGRIGPHRCQPHARRVRSFRSLGGAHGGTSSATVRKPGIVASLSESIVEQAALDWFRALGYSVVGGPDMPPGPHALRASYADTILPSVVRDTLARLNPKPPRRGAGRRLPQADPPRRIDPGSPQPHLPPPGGGRGHGRVPRPARRDSRRAGAGVRLRDTLEQRLARGQPAHRDREQPRTPPRRRAVRQRPATRRRRAEEPGRRGRDAAQRLATAPDLPGRAAVAVRLQRGARGLGRRRGPARHPHRGVGVVQAVAHHLRRGAGAGVPYPAPGGDRGGVREAALSRPSARLHRVRGRRRRATRQEDGGIPPVPRGGDGDRRDATGGRAATGGPTLSARSPDATSPAASRAVVPATGASVSSGTPRARARA